MNRGGQFVFDKAQMCSRKTYFDCRPITRLQTSSIGIPSVNVCVHYFVCVASSCRLVALKESRVYTHVHTHTPQRFITSACLAPAISACPWSLHSLTRSLIHSLRSIQPPLFVENSSVNGRPSFGCRGWRTLSTTLPLWLLLFGWASSSLEAHPGPTYQETFKVPLFPL